MHRLLGRSDFSRDEWHAAMDRYGVDSALLAYAGHQPARGLVGSRRWALVFRGGDARVFVRRLPRFAALIAARRDPGHVHLFGRGGHDDAAARPAPAGLAGRRLPVEPAARAIAVRARWRASRAGSRAYAGRWRLRRAVSRQPTRRGWVPGGRPRARRPRARRRARPSRAGARAGRPRALHLRRSAAALERSAAAPRRQRPGTTSPRAPATPRGPRARPGRAARSGTIRRPARRRSTCRPPRGRKSTDQVAAADVPMPSSRADRRSRCRAFRAAAPSPEVEVETGAVGGSNAASRFPTRAPRPVGRRS